MWITAIFGNLFCNSCCSSFFLCLPSRLIAFLIFFVRNYFIWESRFSKRVKSAAAAKLPSVERYDNGAVVHNKESARGRLVCYPNLIMAVKASRRTDCDAFTAGCAASVGRSRPAASCGRLTKDHSCRLHFTGREFPDTVSVWSLQRFANILSLATASVSRLPTDEI